MDLCGAFRQESITQCLWLSPGATAAQVSFERIHGSPAGMVCSHQSSSIEGSFPLFRVGLMLSVALSGFIGSASSRATPCVRLRSCGRRSHPSARRAVLLEERRSHIIGEDLDLPRWRGRGVASPAALQLPDDGIAAVAR